MMICHHPSLSARPFPFSLFPFPAAFHCSLCTLSFLPCPIRATPPPISLGDPRPMLCFWGRPTRWARFKGFLFFVFKFLFFVAGLQPTSPLRHLRIPYPPAPSHILPHSPHPPVRSPTLHAFTSTRLCVAGQLGTRRCGHCMSAAVRQHGCGYFRRIRPKS